MALQQQQQPVLSDEELLQQLKYNFLHDSFRPNQLEAIKATLAGRDSLLILPTGGGKSLSFQLPALAKGSCFTVVIGPLMALAKDQVDSCLDIGIDARIWNSDTSDEAKRQVLSELVADEPEMRMLYATPESLRNPTLRSYLKEAYEAGKLLSFAIDEAHCVSEWGHDFRPAYLELASLKSDFPNTPIAALTASCTSGVEASIIQLLGLKDPLVIKGGFNRPNIEYRVVYKELVEGGKQDDMVEHLVQFIQQRPGTCGIIYCRLRATCDWLTSTLGNFDLDVGCYHAGKDAQRRRKVQTEWSSGGLDIVVATLAFGMGIDRADVRWVVHWDVPSSLEGFYQESGRAGRDGQPSESVLYVAADDLDTITKLEKGRQAGAAAAVAGFSCQPGCRREKIVEYFGQRRGACDASQGELLCDYCRAPQATRRLMDEWEQHITRKDVQLTLQKQRQQRAAAQSDDDCDDGGSGSGDAAEQQGAAASRSQQQGRLPRGTSSTQQPVTRAKPGVWGAARHASLGSAAACADARAAGNAAAAAAASGCGGPLRPLHNMRQQQQPTGLHAKAAAGLSTATGVRAAAVPASVPQLVRKRAAATQAGAAFKSPRMTAAVGSSSSACGPSASGGASPGAYLQQQQQHEAVTGSSQVNADLQQQGASCGSRPQPPIGCTSSSGGAGGGMAQRVSRMSRASSGRAAFVPPLRAQPR